MEKESDGGFYVIARLHKDDIKTAFRNDKQALEKIDKLTEAEMSYIASKLQNDYLTQLFWQSLRDIVTELFLSKEDITKDGK